MRFPQNTGSSLVELKFEMSITDEWIWSRAAADAEGEKDAST